MSSAALVVRSLSINYHRGGERIDVLERVDWQVPENQAVAIMGASGSGKSTLLNLLAGFERPSEGTIEWVGHGNIAAFSGRQRVEFHRRSVGFVFQRFNLLPDLTGFQNIVVALKLGGRTQADAAAAALSAAGRLGVTDLLSARVSTMSQGQAQRIAIARALAKSPAIVLADEPTGSVDEANGRAILDLMLEVRRTTNGTLIVATHDQAVARRCDATFQIENRSLIHKVS